MTHSINLLGLGQLEGQLTQLNISSDDTTAVLGRAIPPLATWNPEYCGEINICITADGQWWHEGSRMTRQRLIDLFATVLWVEEYQGELAYFLKTPVEKLKITVEDVPLLVVQVEQWQNAAQQLVWRATTSTGDIVDLGLQHPLELRVYQGQMRPYILIRGRLWALVHRNSFYHLLAQARILDDSGTQMEICSGEHTFILHAGES